MMDEQCRSFPQCFNVRGSSPTPARADHTHALPNPGPANRAVRLQAHLSTVGLHAGQGQPTVHALRTTPTGRPAFPREAGRAFPGQISLGSTPSAPEAPGLSVQCVTAVAYHRLAVGLYLNSAAYAQGMEGSTL